MKTNLFINTAAFAFISAFSAGAIATPVYSGPTQANFDTYPGAAGSNDAGYYIWSSNEGRDWSVRWSGNDNGVSGRYSWFGAINLQNLKNDSLVEIDFEGNNDSVSFPDDPESSGFDLVQFDAIAGPNWDGFDFSLVSPEQTQVIDFALGTSFLTGLEAGSEYVDGQNIFLGASFSAPLVQIQNFGTSDENRVVQRFEVSQVPESATFALLGLGLLGLGLRLNKRSA